MQAFRSGPSKDTVKRRTTMKKKVIQLPRGYISYSQKQLWKNDKQRYKEIYFDNRDELRTSNAGMEYGKVVADALEKGVQTDDLLTDSAMLLLPKYDVADQEIRVEFKTKEGTVMVLAKPDTRDSKSWAFREYKTGKTRWTQKKAQEHPQMRFYAMAIYLASGKVIREAHLDWIETFDMVTATDDSGLPTERKITPTGHVETFTVKFTLNDILNEMADTARVAKEIEIAYASHIPRKELAF